MTTRVLIAIGICALLVAGGSARAHGYTPGPDEWYRAVPDATGRWYVLINRIASPIRLTLYERAASLRPMVEWGPIYGDTFDTPTTTANPEVLTASDRLVSTFTLSIVDAPRRGPAVVVRPDGGGFASLTDASDVWVQGGPKRQSVLLFNNGAANYVRVDTDELFRVVWADPQVPETCDAIAFNAQGNHLVCIAASGRVRLLDPMTGEVVRGDSSDIGKLLPLPATPAAATERARLIALADEIWWDDVQPRVGGHPIAPAAAVLLVIGLLVIAARARGKQVAWRGAHVPNAAQPPIE
jgi:hypothetical protein